MVGRLWLHRPPNGAADAEAHIREAAAAAEALDTASALKRSEKRRAAAEEATVRSLADVTRLTAIVDEQQAEVDRLRAELTKADESLAEAKVELIDVRNEARHSRDREAAASAKLAAVIAERDALREATRTAPEIPPAADVAPTEFELQQLRDLADVSARAAADASQRVAAMIARLERSVVPPVSEPATQASARGRRRPVPLPGGIIASSAEAASFLARSGAAMIVDGYNVAMLGWPNLTLEAGRSALIESMENLARRFGTEVITVFDGAGIVGAHAGRRRATRVVFSPPGVIADDVIRREIERLPADRHIVVVTNDAEVVRDARAAGCNVVSSNALLAVL
ncbi:MAG: NYN domain-containing protein [Ilumatobacteraceae bacterium]